MFMQNTSGFLSYQNKKVVTILLLLATFVVPVIGFIGVILMWLWMKWKNWLKVLITIPFVIVLLSLFSLASSIFIRPVQIKGSSMEPGFKEGQYYITYKINKQDEIVRGDVVIFAVPTNDTFKYIKRVVALPNERVMIKDGIVYVNGQKLDETAYMITTTTTVSANSLMTEDEEITIPANNYFLLSDNRDKSQDSRIFGAVPRTNIVSKIGFCYWKCWK